MNPMHHNQTRKEDAYAHPPRFSAVVFSTAPQN